MKQAGFTLIELVLVLAIMSSLIILTVAGLNGFRANQYVAVDAQNVLASIQHARALAIDNVSAINDSWVYGYVLFLNNTNNSTGYCIDKWYDRFGGDPTLGTWTFHGTLAQLASVSHIGTQFVQCPGSANPNGGNGYIAVDAKAYDNRSNISIYFSPANVAYAAFESLTGDIYFYDSNGNYIDRNTMNSVAIFVKDTQTPANTKEVFLYDKTTFSAQANQPYIK